MWWQVEWTKEIGLFRLASSLFHAGSENAPKYTKLTQLYEWLPVKTDVSKVALFTLWFLFYLVLF